MRLGDFQSTLVVSYSLEEVYNLLVKLTSTSVKLDFLKIDINKVPNTPGVYKFFNNHEIIYIGKAKDLKKELRHILVNLIKIEKHLKLSFLQIK